MELENYRLPLMDTAKQLFAVDSPSGFTHDVIMLAKELAEAQGYTAECINKGNLLVRIPAGITRKPSASAPMWIRWG